MGTENFLKLQRVLLRDHSTLREKWVQECIANDPTILGLGDLDLKDKERLQPNAGRLDLLLQDPDPENGRRYEVEVQLGATDESHIIRTLEYWDVERKRYPQYEHIAVIVAENITSRFLNVISLFNGTIPLIAIQMSAYQVGDQVALTFTTVMDVVRRGRVDEDEETQVVVDRPYWEERASKTTMEVVDKVQELMKAVNPSLGIRYNKYYLIATRDGVTDSFMWFKPKKEFLTVSFWIKQSPQLNDELDKAGVDYDYRSQDNSYRTRIKPADFAKNRELLARFTKLASENERQD